MRGPVNGFIVHAPINGSMHTWWAGARVARWSHPAEVGSLSFGIEVATTDGSNTLINGTSDWVNEEELDLRDCFRWSPDGQSIAFWQFDTTRVREFQLVNNTDDTYPRITSFAYPKTGEQNSATRIGIVSADGGSVRWLNIPGDPREHYLPHMEWTPNGSQLMLQQLNRLQNTNRVMLADPKTQTTRVILTEMDDAWLENENPIRWIKGRSLIKSKAIC